MRLVLELESVMLTKYETKSHRVKGMFFIHIQVDHKRSFGYISMSEQADGH